MSTDFSVRPVGAPAQTPVVAIPARRRGRDGAAARPERQRARRQRGGA